jgi:hypothetical protein
MRFTSIKKIVILLSAAGVIGLMNISPLKAQGSDSIYLQQIAANTLNTVQLLNQVPAMITSLGKFITAWMNPDNSDAATTLQGSFTQLGTLLTSDLTTQNSLQASLNANLLNNDGSNIFNVNVGKPTATGLATAKTFWYANDLVYSTLLGTPYFAKDPRNQQKANSVDPALNYIKNASGINIYHVLPNDNWQGTVAAQARYQSYFNTVMAAESFNAYVLSGQYADKNQFNALQTTLIQQASDPAKWFAKVSSENIGFVLRQLLFYQSQAFVLLSQLVQTQKQMVTAQAMTNSTLIAINQINESLLVSSAKGQQASLS